MKSFRDFFCVDQFNKREDYSFYQLGKIIWIPVIALGVIFADCIFPRFFENNYPCLFESLTGYPCPGCGGTRAVVALFQGRILASFFYNPAVLSIVFCYLHFMILFFLRKNVFKNIENRKISVEVYAYVFIFVIIVQWIVKCIVLFVLSHS